MLSKPGFFNELVAPADLRDLFDPPLPPPPAAGPPYSGGPPTLAGDLTPEREGRPLKELCALITGLPLSEAEKLVEFGSMWLNNSRVEDPSFPLPPKGSFRLNFPEYGPVKFYEGSPDRIIFEDSDVIVYDKESGRPSQGVPYDSYNNVHSALTRRRGLFLRLPHRLDLGTSGFLLLAKNQRAAGFLGKSFQRGAVSKRYLALATGEAPQWREKDVEINIARIQNRFTVRENGPGLPSRTSFKLLSAQDGLLLFLAVPHTGRTHQIRLHLSHLGYPIMGDNFYGGEIHPRLMLRASGLSFTHPTSRLPVVLGGPFEEAVEGGSA
ncbi:MAG: RluA family pseudouridine synthase [Deltaproteobacteria bacterium]|jgi:23S rRNA pseudouridine1911/1915/1917 synthase|nr:RluA family pseudouridine synthase [Deltaproteobacteria bacterium]